MRLALVEYAYDIIVNFANKPTEHCQACSIQHRMYRSCSGIRGGSICGSGRDPVRIGLDQAFEIDC